MRHTVSDKLAIDSEVHIHQGQALKGVKSNKGSAGIDGMTVDELPAYLKEHWPAIRDQLLSGTTKPQPVKRVETWRGQTSGGSNRWQCSRSMAYRQQSGPR